MALSSGAGKLSSVICNVGLNPPNWGCSYTSVRAIPLDVNVVMIRFIKQGCPSRSGWIWQVQFHKFPKLGCSYTGSAKALSCVMMPFIKLSISGWIWQVQFHELPRLGCSYTSLAAIIAARLYVPCSLYIMFTHFRFSADVQCIYVLQNWWSIRRRVQCTQNGAKSSSPTTIMISTQDLPEINPYPHGSRSYLTYKLAMSRTFGSVSHTGSS